MTQSVTSKTYGTVLGARIKFPEGSYNSYAIIKPPFEIPAYDRPTKYANGDVVPLTDQEIADALFISAATELVANPAFRLKLVLILMAGVNALVFHARDSLRRQYRWARWQAGASLLIWLAEPRTKAQAT